MYLTRREHCSRSAAAPIRRLKPHNNITRDGQRATRGAGSTNHREGQIMSRLSRRDFMAATAGGALASRFVRSAAAATAPKPGGTLIASWGRFEPPSLFLPPRRRSRPPLPPTQHPPPPPP